MIIRNNLAAGVNIYHRKTVISIGKIMYQRLAKILKIISKILQSSPMIVPIIDPQIIKINISNMTITFL